MNLKKLVGRPFIPGNLKVESDYNFELNRGFCSFCKTIQVFSLQKQSKLNQILNYRFHFLSIKGLLQFEMKLYTSAVLKSDVKTRYIHGKCLRNNVTEFLFIGAIQTDFYDAISKGFLVVSASRRRLWNSSPHSNPSFSNIGQVLYLLLRSHYCTLTKEILKKKHEMQQFLISCAHWYLPYLVGDVQAMCLRCVSSYS